MNELDQAAQRAVYSLYALAVCLTLCYAPYTVCIALLCVQPVVHIVCCYTLAVCLTSCYAPYTVCIALLCV